MHGIDFERAKVWHNFGIDVSKHPIKCVRLIVVELDDACLTLNEVNVGDGVEERTSLAEDVLVKMPCRVLAGDGEVRVSSIVQKPD